MSSPDQDDRGRPLQNRVRPDGAIVAVPQRGAWMGNRGGVIHDEQGRIVRAQAGRGWLICRLEFRGRRRRVMQPDRYTELFFLDEATGLAAGHRPCAECRHAQAVEFRDRFRRTTGRRRAGMPTLDALLSEQRHRKRAPMGADKRMFTAPVAALPHASMVVVGDDPFLVTRTRPDAAPRLRRWSFDGYGEPMAATDEPVVVLTPAATIDILADGYRPQVHPTATG